MARTPVQTADESGKKCGGHEASHRH